MSDIKDLTKEINKWVKDRGRGSIQNPKDLALSLLLEATEVLEHFQWKNNRKSWQHVRENKEEMADELADVGIFLFKLADKIDIDLADAIKKKLIKASKKYPANKVRGDTKEYYRRKKLARQK